jgi:hypothetical protein
MFSFEETLPSRFAMATLEARIRMVKDAARKQC